MPSIFARTKTQIRQSVGYNVYGGDRSKGLYVSTASATNSTTVLVDNTLAAGATNDNRQVSRWVLFNSGTAGNIGLIREVTASTVASSITYMTVAPAATNNITSGDGYELWPRGAHPSQVIEMINQAVLEVQGRAYDDEESFALSGDWESGRYDIPSEFDMLNGVLYRAWVKDLTVEECETAWDESVASGVTVAADTEQFRGRNSIKFTVADSVGVNTTLATQDIASLDISGYDTLEVWVLSSVATNAGDLLIYLDDTASCASALESLSVPALTARTPTRIRISLANPESDTAIISVGLRQVVDIGACNIWLRRMKVVRHSSAEWVELGWHLWDTDQEAQDLILNPAAVSIVGDKLLKLTGGSNPSLLSTANTSAAEAGVLEVADQYVIARATALMLMANLPENPSEREGVLQKVRYIESQAQGFYAALPPLEGVRECK